MKRIRNDSVRVPEASFVGACNRLKLRAPVIRVEVNPRSNGVRLASFLLEKNGEKTPMSACSLGTQTAAGRPAFGTMRTAVAALPRAAPTQPTAQPIAAQAQGSAASGSYYSGGGSAELTIPVGLSSNPSPRMTASLIHTTVGSPGIGGAARIASAT